MRILSLFTFVFTFVFFFNICFAYVSNIQIFPNNVTIGEKVMILASVRVNDENKDSCDLGKPYNFSYEYNYSSKSIKGTLNEIPSIYSFPNEKIKLYSAKLKAENNSNLSVIINCSNTDIFNPEKHLETKLIKINTGKLNFTYPEDRFYFKNKPNDTIILYPFEIITMDGKSISDENIQNYTLTYSIYSLYTGNAVEKKVFQKQLDLYYSSSNNIFSFDASYPIGYIVFEGGNKSILGGNYFLFYTIPFSFSLNISDAFEKGDTCLISADYNLYYDLFPNNISVKIKQPDNNENNIFLLKSRNYQENYLFNQTGIYFFNATAESDIYATNYSKYINVTEAKNISFSTDKNIYYVGDILYINATLLKKGVPQALCNNSFVQIKKTDTVYAKNETPVKINNICIFSIPLNNFSANNYNVFVSIEDKNKKKYTNEKIITVKEEQTLINFTISPAFINETFFDKKIQKTINISNTGEKNISKMNITISKTLKDIIVVNESSFSLNISKSKSIVLSILPPNYELVKGEIWINTTGFCQKINITLYKTILYSAKLKPDKYYCQELIGHEREVELKLKNTGNVPLNNISFHISNELKKYFLKSTIPDIIEINEEKNILFNLGNFKKEETISEIISIYSNNITNTVNITILVVEDISQNIKDIKNRKEKMALRLSALKSTTQKKNIAKLFDKLQLSISELNSDYGNEKYLDAKEKIQSIEDQIDSIVLLIEEIESSEDTATENSYCGDQICNSDEDEISCSLDCSTTDNGNVSKKTSWFIIFAVLIVVAVVIVFSTSIVPDDYKKEEEE